MDMREALHLMMWKSKKSMTQLSYDMGKSRAYVSTTMNKTDGEIGARKIAEMASKCGYRLMLVPEEVEVDGGLEIDPKKSEAD